VGERELVRLLTVDKLDDSHMSHVMPTTQAGSLFLLSDSLSFSVSPFGFESGGGGGGGGCN
jgi:hypothetical protein